MNIQIGKNVLFLLWLLFSSPIAAASPSTPSPHSVAVYTGEFNRRPAFKRQQLRHTFPQDSLASIRVGDLNCDGLADIVTYDSHTASILVGLTDPANQIISQTPSPLPAETTWEEMRVVTLAGDACATLLAPRGVVDNFARGVWNSDAKTLNWSIKNVNYDGGVLGPFLFAHPNSTIPQQFISQRPVSEGSLAVGSVDSEGAFRLHTRMSLPGRLIGFMNLDDTPTGTPVFELKTGVYAVLDQTEASIPLFRLPPNYRWHREILADINGDAISELIIPGKGIQGTWIAFSYGKGLLTIPNTSLSDQTIFKNGILAAGDFDGNGTEDLFTHDLDSLYVYLSELPTAVPNTPVAINDLQYTSDSEGKLDISLATESLVATPTKMGTGFLQRRIERTNLVSLSKLTILLDLETRAELGRLLTPRDTEPNGPFVCNGFSDTAAGVLLGRVTSCPTNFAFLEFDDSISALSGSCCKLPFNGMLEESSSWHEAVCPVDSIVVEVEDSVSGSALPFRSKPPRVRCKKINTELYTLTEKIPGVSFGDASSSSRRAEFYDRSALPLAIRNGISRSDLSSWDSDGCLSPQLDGVLVGILGPRCQDRLFASFRVVSKTGAAAIPTSRIAMFPECDELADLYDPSRGCKTVDGK